MDNKNQKDLPKLLADLPLPEKEIPANLASQGDALRSYKRLPLILLIPLVLLILLVLVGGAYFLGKNSANKQATTPIGSPEPTAKAATPTPDPTADWETYTDSKYSFSIKYPPSWRQNPNTPEFSGNKYRISFDDGTHSGKLFNIFVTPNPNHLSSLDYIRTEAFKNEDPMLGWNNAKRPAYALNLPNIDATQMDTIVGGATGEFGPVIFISKNGYAFEIESFISKTDNNLLNQILSTFKFTE